MTGLLKADFRRVFKDKLLLVMGILAVVFATITPLLYVLITGVGDFTDEMTKEALSTMYSSKVQFFQSFSLGNNLGLIAPVLLAIVLCKDFSFGTIRNKIIAGKSRSQIFLSLFLTCSTVLAAVIFLHAFLTLGISLIFFPYQSEPFTTADLGYFFLSVLFELLSLLFVSAMLSWLCASRKNVGLVIVLYIAISFVLVMAGSITQVTAQLMEAMGGNETTISVLRFLDRINVVSSSTYYIGMGESYELEDVLYLTIPALVSIACFLGLGLWKFNKKDFK